MLNIVTHVGDYIKLVSEAGSSSEIGGTKQIDSKGEPVRGYKIQNWVRDSHSSSTAALKKARAAIRLKSKYIYVLEWFSQSLNL